MTTNMLQMDITIIYCTYEKVLFKRIFLKVELLIDNDMIFILVRKYETELQISIIEYVGKSMKWIKYLYDL